ncbi:MAG: TIGR00266 family protein [Myxococcales bacterium]|nr:TIGR00266 family protein [Myxococcales bacterium]
MRIEVSHRPAYALATALLEPGEAVVAEGGAMVSMDTAVTISTHKVASREPAARRRGCLGAIFGGFRRMLGGESFYQNRFVATGSAGAVTFAPKTAGDIEVYELGEQCGLIMQSAAFLCSAETVGVDANFGGAKAFLAGEGLYMLRASGEGLVAFNSFGAIQEMQIEDHYVVDSGHIVAFEDSLDYDVRPFSRGLIKAIFGGEALVCEFSGQGRVWIQSRNPKSFGQTLAPLLPKRRR